MTSFSSTVPNVVKCSGCEEEKPFTLEHFKPDKKLKEGLTRTCRVCRNAYSKEWKGKNKKRLDKRRKELYNEKERVVEARRVADRWRTYPEKRRAQVLRSGMRDRSKALGLTWDSEVLTVRYLTEWLENQPTCECCRRAFRLQPKGDRTKGDSSPSIDRIRPDKGYVIGNVALLCWRCNNLKRDSTPAELRQVADWMARVWGDEV